MTIGLPLLRPRRRRSRKDVCSIPDMLFASVQTIDKNTFSNSQSSCYETVEGRARAHHRVRRQDLPENMFCLPSSLFSLKTRGNRDVERAAEPFYRV